MLSAKCHMTLIVRSFTSIVILKKEFVFIAEKDLPTKRDLMRDIIQTVESMRLISADTKGTLNIGSKYAANVVTLETYIRSMMEMLTGLASQVTGLDAVGKIVTVEDSTTAPQFPRTFRLDDAELGYGE